MQSKIELLDRNGYLSLAKNISLFLSTPREMNTWEHGWRSQVLLFHLRNYIYFFFLVNRGRRRSEMKARSTEDRRSRIPLRRISSLFFFSAEFFLSSFIITHIYLWGQVNFRQISRRSFARWTKFRRMFQSHAMEKIGSFSIMV